MDSMTLTVLGGGQSIGASCHLLEIGRHAILLDCGKGKRMGTLFGPDFTPMLLRGRLPQEIENVFISHAHFDHIGFLPELKKVCGSVPVYASRLTGELGRVLLWDNYDGAGLTDAQRRTYERDFADAFAAVSPVSYCRPMDFGDYRVTFYEAGHIPGAAAIYVESEAGSVLYTGDFSLGKTMLSGGLTLPEGFQADTIILDGTYARRPDYRCCGLFDLPLDWLRAAKHRPVSIRTRQLTKGVETLGLILRQMETCLLPETKVLLDGELWNVAQAFMSAGIPVLKENCCRFTDEALWRCGPGVYLTTKPLHALMEERHPDYSLHSDFGELKAFAEAAAKKNVVVVHAPPTKERWNTYALEDACSRDLNFIYPETGETYVL